MQRSKLLLKGVFTFIVVDVVFSAIYYYGFEDDLNRTLISGALMSLSVCAVFFGYMYPKKRKAIRTK